MEKHIAAVMICLCAFLFSARAQENSEEKIQLQLWALQDAYPEIKETKPYEQAKIHLKSSAEFLLCGMTYGWKFTYTPSDKLRNVSEYFECVPLHPFDDDKKNISYEQMFAREDKIFCWVGFDRTEQMVKYYRQFNSIQNPHVVGIGKAKLSKGFEGFQEAAYNSVKNGVREYYRKITKNKPKEITGTILIRKIPAVYIDSGNYVVELDFFLQTGKIKEYRQF